MDKFFSPGQDKAFFVEQGVEYAKRWLKSNPQAHTESSQNQFFVTFSPKHNEFWPHLIKPSSDYNHIGHCFTPNTSTHSLHSDPNTSPHHICGITSSALRIYQSHSHYHHSHSLFLFPFAISF